MSTPAVTAEQAVAPAGWYPDPANPSSRRYWDGSTWTAQTTPSAGAPAVTSGLIVAGYLLAVFAPLIGFVLGLVAVNKHDGRGTNHGLWIIVTSSALMFLWVLLMIASAGSASA
jgi:hypothetical protein